MRYYLVLVNVSFEGLKKCSYACPRRGFDDFIATEPTEFLFSFPINTLLRSLRFADEAGLQKFFKIQKFFSHNLPNLVLPPVDLISGIALSTLTNATANSKTETIPRAFMVR